MVEISILNKLGLGEKFLRWVLHVEKQKLGED